MRLLVLILVVSCWSLVVSGQSNWGVKDDTNRVWTDLDSALAHKDEVIHLDLTKQKLTSIPKEVFLLKNLEILNVGRNKLTKLPIDLNKLEFLRILIAERNKIATFPIAVCSMKNLEQLIINRNVISTIPTCIQYAQNLIYLDLWSNTIETVPDEISKLINLKEFDLRGMTYAPEFNARIKALLPHAQVKMEPPCDCMAGEE